MSDDHFQSEPVRGLPERPPEGETVLWQGSPDWRLLARHALGLRTIAAYFGLLATWRLIDQWAATGPGEGLIAAGWFVLIGGVALGLLAGMAFLMAKATVYTITSRRVAMRIGIALTVTLNLPYTQIESADLAVDGQGRGDLYLRLTPKARLSYLVCWPHVRPWRMARSEPALRCIADARRVGLILGQAAAARVTEVGPVPAMTLPMAAE